MGNQNHQQIYDLIHTNDLTRDTGLTFDKPFDQEDQNFDHHMRFVIIEQINNHSSLSKLENRRIVEQREDFWIKKLKTLDPFGLNDWLNLACKLRIHAICS